MGGFFFIFFIDFLKLRCYTGLMLTDKAAKFFSSIRDKEISNYNNYWSQLQPRFIDEAFKRYVFAFLSVHTTWENNCKAYNILKDFNKWKDDEALLH